MSWTPTDAQVEKAAWQVADWLSDRDEGPSEAHREAARAVLVAVGPHIAAQAWDEAVNAITYPAIDEGRSRMTLRLVLPLPENPYSEKAAGR